MSALTPTRRLFGASVRMEIPQGRLHGILLAQTDTIVVAKADSRTKTVTATPMLERIVHTILALMYARAPYTVLQRAMFIHPTVSELLPTMMGRLKPL